VVLIEKKRGRQILFPTKIALLFVLPSLALYLFFNTWPMIFSVGIAFTNADRKNILPNPQLKTDYESLLKCALYLRDSPEYKSSASTVGASIIKLLNDTLSYFNGIKSILDSGSGVEDIPQSYFDNLYRSTRAISRIKLRISEFFNCTAIGFPTSVELIPSDELEKIDSLITLAAQLTNPTSLSRDQLYNYTITGYNITMDLIVFFNRLESDYEGYMNQVIMSSRKELDSLEMKFIGAENFARLFRDPRFYNALYKTLLFVATSVALKMTVGVLLAIFYSSELIIGRKALRALLIVPWAMPFLLSALTWRLLFQPNGQLGRLFNLSINTKPYDAFLVYNLFETWLAYPFVMTVTQGALRGIPKDVIEASYIDGAGTFMRFKQVILPLIAKPVSLAAVLTTGASLQAFLVPLTLNGAGPIGNVCAPGVGCTAGYMNEMLIIFGYYRVTIDKEYGYAASIYLVVLAIILVYVAIYFKLLKKARRP
jgi:arabinogalactan oligomer/maltooligosaccharide transport system permease protein